MITDLVRNLVNAIQILTIYDQGTNNGQLLDSLSFSILDIFSGSHKG